LLSLSYFTLSLYDQAQPLLEEALRIREEVASGEAPEVAQSLHQLAALYHAKAEAGKADSLYRRALEMRRRILAPTDARIAETLIRYSELPTDQGRYGEAERLLMEALDILEKGNADPIQTSAVTNRLGTLQWIQGDLETAEQSLRQTLSERQLSLPPDHPLVSESLNNLAILLEDLGRAEEALVLYREALVAVEAAFGESSDHVSSILGNIGLILSQTGEWTEAESLLRRAMAIDLQLMGPDHPVVGVDKINLGLLLCDADQPAEGLTLVTEAMGVFERFYDREQWEMGAALSARGHCLGRVGRFSEGEQDLLAALETAEEALGPGHERVQKVRERLVQLYEAWNRPDQAARYRD